MFQFIDKIELICVRNALKSIHFVDKVTGVNRQRFVLVVQS